MGAVCPEQKKVPGVVYCESRDPNLCGLTRTCATKILRQNKGENKNTATNKNIASCY